MDGNAGAELELVMTLGAGVECVTAASRRGVFVSMLGIDAGMTVEVTVVLGAGDAMVDGFAPLDLEVDASSGCEALLALLPAATGLSTKGFETPGPPVSFRRSFDWAFLRGILCSIWRECFVSGEYGRMCEKCRSRLLFGYGENGLLAFIYCGTGTGLLPTTYCDLRDYFNKFSRIQASIIRSRSHYWNKSNYWKV